MQERPLHMVMVKHTITIPVYAHCLGLNHTPRITITSHKAKDKKSVWYLGGRTCRGRRKIQQGKTNRYCKKRIKTIISMDRSFQRKFQ